MPYRVNPIPMGSQAAAGQSTPAMQMQMAKAYGSRGGRASAARRKARPKKATKRRAKKNGGRKLKFGSPAYRAKYLGKGRRKKR